MTVNNPIGITHHDYLPIVDKIKEHLFKTIGKKSNMTHQEFYLYLKTKLPDTKIILMLDKLLSDLSTYSRNT